MAQLMHVEAKWQSGWSFEVETGSGFSVALDGASPHTAMSPMEMLLAALAGCTGVSVISVLEKMRQEVTGYEIRISGARAETHPKVFTEITVEHIFTGHKLRPESIARAIELSETRYCGVSAMLSKTAKITNSYQISETA
ncbi:MAG TPA: OsmC family protein [Ktedonobacteraceae bacterium]|nr:OsmC family protein [Ktedonobacteraceae bacterium]